MEHVEYLASNLGPRRWWIVSLDGKIDAKMYNWFIENSFGKSSVQEEIGLLNLSMSNLIKQL